MSIEMNISCRACRHRHPPSWSCGEAEARAVAALEQRQAGPREPQVRPGTKYMPVPSEAGNIVAMTLFRDRLYVAFQYGVYRREDDDTWTQILSVGPL